MTPNLLPCPFCGGEAESRLFDAQYFVQCIQCFNSTAADHDLEESAASAWNARAQSAPAEVAQGDDVFVVGYHCRDGKGLSTLNWLPHEKAVPLMTVAQHNRIVAALTDSTCKDGLPVAQGEAVAWLHKSKVLALQEGWSATCYGKPWADRHFKDGGFVPLYTAPPSPDAELVALLRDAAAWFEGRDIDCNLTRDIDAKLASLKGDRNDDVPKPD